jgi:hypothetical protein
MRVSGPIDPLCRFDPPGGSAPCRRVLVLPEASEAVIGQRGVADRRCDRPVAQIVLDCPRILAVIGQLVAAAMAQHVAVDQEREACCLSGPGDHALIASHA